ncbi:NDP-hexose 2,3-dehydratase family protein [Streptomyces sp. NPDC048606]|uniref:NDP-hexose 2,3-dehydratase family protein n=1 Tax=Streptomyces sp. NPDC048606 TaxID=3154726 RepID=UPI00341C5957
MTAGLETPPVGASVGASVLALRLTESAAATDSPVCPNASFDTWFARHREANRFTVARIPFAQLSGWSFRESDGNLVHTSGGFFSVVGLEVNTDWQGRGTWAQPILDQPEVGVLGILVKEFDGVLHCLMQAKMEPGNPDTVQLSPTVQATRSNYTGVHGGRRTTFLEYFTDPDRSTLVDSLQSEQGSWFLRKRNRNMVVEVTGEVPDHENFRWLTLGQIHRLLGDDNVVNMDTRSVVACMPFTAPAGPRRLDAGAGSGAAAASRYREVLGLSLSGRGGALHDMEGILGWLTEAKARREFSRRLLPLSGVYGWHRSDTEISHAEGRHFTVVAVDVRAETREVTDWSQPLIAPVEQGVAAFVVRPIDGVLHVLMHAKVEAGLLDVCELAPTVQCLPVNYADLPPERRPAHLETVLRAPAEAVRFDAVLSEEGGRFHHADNRYLVVEVGEDFPVEQGPDHRWMTVHQLMDLVRHSRYLNVQARSLLACLRTTW